jgi:hypothetical protein
MSFPPPSNITPVPPGLTDTEDPNILLLKLIKNDWGADARQDFKYQKHKVRFMGQDQFYDGQGTPCLVFWWMADDVGRWGVASGKRYHHSKHRVWVFCRDPDERWQVVKECERILAKYAINPSPNMLRVDYYKITPWQQESPVQKLFRATIDCTVIWVG